MASDIKTSKLLSQEWVYKNIFNMSDVEWKAEQVKVINDLKLGFRQAQIENEGNDPVKPKLKLKLTAFLHRPFVDR